VGLEFDRTLNEGLLFKYERPEKGAYSEIEKERRRREGDRKGMAMSEDSEAWLWHMSGM
jgi:hypothetical protein